MTSRPKNPIRLHLQKLSQQFRNILRSPLSSSDDEILECEVVRDDIDRFPDVSKYEKGDFLEGSRDDENNYEVSPKK